MIGIAASIWDAGVGPVASAFGTAASAVAADAAALKNVVAGLPGNFGRYSAGGDPLIPYVTATDVPSAIALAAGLRAAVAAAAASLAGAGTPAAFAAAASAVTEAVRNACADPADALRLLPGLVLFQAPDVGGTGDPLSLEIRGLGADAAWVLRRAAGISLARAARDHRPSSQSDAATVSTRVGHILEALALSAADRFDDAVYHALHALENAVVADLRARGASLAPVVEQNFKMPLPAAVIAWNLYQDAARASDILARNNDQPHPSMLASPLEALAA